MQYITTPHMAEVNAAEKMRSWGYIDAKATTGGADGGIDVRSKHALAQVKWRGAVAGRPDLQRLYGARGMDTGKRLFFFAATGYSKAALEYAKDVSIDLFVYDPLGNIHPVNRTGLPQGIAPKWNGDDWWVIGALVFAFVLSLWLLIIVVIA